MNIETLLAQAGNRRDPLTGAVAAPIHLSATYSHPAAGQSTGYDYSRMANPTRTVLEETIARLERGVRGFAFASGMAAIHAVCSLLSPGDHVIASDDLYGGTYRLFEQILRPLGITVSYLRAGCTDALRPLLTERTKALFLETPTNPTMKVYDIAGLAKVARAHGALTVVDNTFMTPYYQRPLELGADIVLHSGTKYLGGHNDVVCGLVAVRDEALAERIAFFQNAIGAVLGPHDSYLMVRGLKTLALRMERHNQNARAIADWLVQHPLVTRVYYPGLPNHPGRDVHERQASGYGGMVSFEVQDVRLVEPILNHVRIITFAESLGGVESLITYPSVQTHHDIPPEERAAIGVTDTLLRLSVGIEHPGDLMADLDQAFAQARRALEAVQA
ncbi:trans-sulfuration enzyme family protein [Alicyclobacillus shizuokensis]|uniref:trans-sulfuration enzyme family protein n=1 Tax=Alicyclobacillus shizuokensis TaxID=392014 RepID=UPI0008311E82|nr:PLP-dependent aspartate aminotransferase family protein [Alicyclobacillus shizuokensis]MCL6627571.1 PLP-dependent aspartate aminotransferase family protein [Alicyclobacillus shizuokensis]